MKPKALALPTPRALTRSPFSKAKIAEIRKVFNDSIKGETDPDRIANVELLREYFCNPTFRKAMSDIVFEIIQKKESSA